MTLSGWWSEARLRQLAFTRFYSLAPGLLRETAFVASQLLAPLPPDLWLPATYDVRVSEIIAVDVAADDMVVQMIVDERT